MPDCLVLSAWDLALLDRHRQFYEALASFRRQPTTAAQAHFVAAALGHSTPVTQHEVAFHRYRSGWHDPRCTLPGPAARAWKSVPSPQVERCVDLADMALLVAPSERIDGTFRHVKRLYVEGRATGRRASADAAVWLSAALADAGLARSLENWTSDTFGNLSDAYTRSMDGDFATGLRAGGEYVSPWLHRLFEGHTLGAAWEAVREALPDDALTDEVVGWLRALGSDFVTVVGLPVASLSPEAFGQIEAFLASTLGVPREWLIDVLHWNAAEGIQLAAGGVAVVAAAMGWGPSDAEAFAKLAGGLGVSAVVGANPIMILVALALLAKAYEMAKAEGKAGVWRSLLQGGAPAATALAIAATTGGPPVLGIVTGIFVAHGLREAVNSRGLERSGWMESHAERIAEAFRRFASCSAGSFRPVA